MRKIFTFWLSLTSVLLLVILGTSNASSSPGQLDTSFNGTGMVTVAFLEARDVAIQTDGKIVVVGLNANVSARDFGVVRLNSDGSLDNTFDSDGRLTTSIGADDRAHAVAIQTDGKIVVAGWTESGVNYDFCVVRYNNDGSLDTTFDTDGKVTVPVGAGNDFVYTLTLQTDGKIVVAGASSGFSVIRLNSDGTLDSSFDGDGKAIIPVGTSAEAHDIVVQPDGKIAIGGFTIVGSSWDFVAVRLNADGTPDTAFDGDGVVTTGITNHDQAMALELQADGKIVLAGQTTLGSSAYHFGLVRYNVDGSLDNGFGTAGKVITSVPNVSKFATSMFIEASGKIVVGGHLADATTGYDFMSIRYNSDGSLDSSLSRTGNLWGSGGMEQIRLAGADQSFAMKPDLQGRPVMVGTIGGSFGVMRLQNNGPTAATASLGGRVIAGNGRGIANAVVVLTSSNGETRSTRTGSFGFFVFDNLPTGEFYIVTASAKRYSLKTDTVIHQLFSDFRDLEFVGYTR